MEYPLFTAILRSVSANTTGNQTLGIEIEDTLWRAIYASDNTNTTPDPTRQIVESTSMQVLTLRPKCRRIFRHMCLPGNLEIDVTSGTGLELITLCDRSRDASSATLVDERSLFLPIGIHPPKGLVLTYRLWKYTAIGKRDVESVLRRKAAECRLLSVSEVAALLNPTVPLECTPTHTRQVTDLTSLYPESGTAGAPSRETTCLSTDETGTHPVTPTV